MWSATTHAPISRVDGLFADTDITVGGAMAGTITPNAVGNLAYGFFSGASDSLS